MQSAATSSISSSGTPIPIRRIDALAADNDIGVRVGKKVIQKTVIESRFPFRLARGRVEEWFSRKIFSKKLANNRMNSRKPSELEILKAAREQDIRSVRGAIPVSAPTANPSRKNQVSGSET